MPEESPWRSGPWIAMALCALVLIACNGVQEPGSSDPPVTDPPPSVHVRQEIHSLTQPQIDAYRAGVALMKSRPADDPTSWIYQANIHGFPGTSQICDVTPGPVQPAWETCQHGNFFFLPWHRMYLYYFERILRAAAQEAIGDPNYDFTLPYWDYEDPEFEDLPEPFRVPADTAQNPLFVPDPRRAFNCNSIVPGQPCVSASTASATVALSLIPFCNCPAGEVCTDCLGGLTPSEAFGGQFTPVPQHSAGNFGELESQPHNVVHVALGGNVGWMSFVPCAARDPIFWVHHANIDRLWQVWLNQNAGRSNPLGEQVWTDETFQFFDENGQSVTLTACEVLNMATQLDYVYDGVPVENVVLCGAPQPEAVAGPGPPPAAVELAAIEPARRSLGRDAVRVAVNLPPEDVSIETVGEPKRRWVVVEGLTLRTPGAYYQVYLNLPEGTEPDPEGDYFLGNIAIFGEVHEDDPGGSRSFEITDHVVSLQEKGEWSGEVELTFVHGNPSPTIETIEAEPEEFIRFSHVRVIER